MFFFNMIDKLPFSIAVKVKNLSASGTLKVNMFQTRWIRFSILIKYGFAVLRGMGEKFFF